MMEKIEYIKKKANPSELCKNWLLNSSYFHRKFTLCPSSVHATQSLESADLSTKNGTLFVRVLPFLLSMVGKT